MKALDMSNYYGMDYGFMYDFINAYESRQQPSNIHLTNTADFHMYFRYFLQKVTSAIIIDNFPAEWEWDYFMDVLILAGHIGVINTRRFGVIPQQCNPYGYNVFYHPTNIIVTNPVFSASDQTDFVIGDDCEVITLTPDWRGCGDIINAYAQRCALVWSDVDVAGALSKLGYVFAAKDKAVAETYKAMLDDIMSGKLGVVTGAKLFDENSNAMYQLFDNDVSKNFEIVTKGIEAVAKLIQRFDEEIGLPTVQEKKERLISSEVETRLPSILSKIELWVDCINRSLEKVNQMFGYAMKARLRHGGEGV